MQIFGLSTDNARAFWNWKFLGDVPVRCPATEPGAGGWGCLTGRHRVCVQELPQTRAMLNNACDVRLPARLTQAELNQVGPGF